MEFINLLREPDSVLGATENSPFRFEEANCKEKECPVKYEYILKKNSAKIIVYPSGAPVKYLRLRFRGDLSFVDKVYGDQWERSGIGAYVEWRSVMASRVLPWYCYLIGNRQTACYGVKTGADCFAFWQVDTHGVTLFLNLKSGEDGVDLKEPLVACEVVQRFGAEGEDCYQVAVAFSKQMCEKPILPREPIFGVNNWYWAYGDISHESVMKETDYLLKMCQGTKHRPYMILDDGWQMNRPKQAKYIGGPWFPNEKFKDMAKTAREIHAKGAKTGLWFRPLLTLGPVPEEAELAWENGGCILDPSHPYTLERVKEDAKRMHDWGYDLIKHDFSTIDAFGGGLSSESRTYALCNSNRKFFDKSKTSATVMKNLYKAIQEGAGDSEVIGCNVIGHLSAGIHSSQRVGADTSGRSFEWTRRDGINCVMRLPQNDTFFNVDPDCAAFTEKVSAEANLDFLEMCALTGMATLASVTPETLTQSELNRINQIFKIADENQCRYQIINYDKNANPEEFISSDGKQIRRFNWDKVFDGSRCVVEWFD